MNHDSIDEHIALVARMLELNMTDNLIIDAYIERGFIMADITLLLAAGKIIYEARKSAPPPQTMFRRVI